MINGEHQPLAVNTEIPRIRWTTKTDFAQFVETATPVVVQGAFDDAGLDEYDSLQSFVSCFTNLPVTVSNNVVDERLKAVINYSRSGRTVGKQGDSQSAAAEESTVGAYVDEIRSNPRTTRLISEQGAHRELLDVLRIPELLRTLGVRRLRPGGSQPGKADAGCWWFLGNAGNASDLHTDWDGCHVLNHEVFGRKRWILFPPASADRLGVYDIFPTVMLREMSARHIDRFLAYAGGTQTVLEPGETIYIPPFYYHHAGYIDDAMGMAFRYRPPHDDIRKLLHALHRSPCLQNIYSLAVRHLDRAGPALTALEEAYRRDYRNATEKYRAIEDLARDYCTRLGLLENHWKMPPSVFLEQLLASRYLPPAHVPDSASDSPKGLTNQSIRTEFLDGQNRSAHSKAIETEDTGPLIPPYGWSDADSQSDRVRDLINPLTLEEFFSRYFEQSWLLIERGETQRPHEGLYSITELLEDLRCQRIPIHSIKFLAPNSSGKQISVPLPRFSLGELVPIGATDRLPSPIHFEQVAEYIERGTGSLIVNRLDQFVMPVYELMSELSEALRTITQVNAYYTPRDSRTLDFHWDNHDVFILQVAGNKHWKVSDPLLPLPIEGKDYMSALAFEGYEDALESTEFELKPGGLIYLPRGTPHGAWTTETASLHLTVGLKHPSWTEVFEAACLEALQKCEKQLAFRRTCPAVFPNADEQALRKAFRELSGIVTEYVSNTDLRQLAARATCKDPLIFRGQRNPVVEQSTALSRVPCVFFRRHDQEGSQVKFQGKNMCFPPVASQAVEFVSTRRYFSVGEIPGLTADERLVFAKRLLREGFLRPAV